jgi:flagellar motor switch protein FliM
MSQTLNQDEIDSLLSKSKDNEDGVEATSNAIPVSYDLANNSKSIYGRVATLSLINERFAKHAKKSIHDFLRRNVEVTVLGLKICKFQEYISSLLMPSSISMVKINPLKGTSLFVADSTLVFTVVENFFGGEGKTQSKTETREFTATENRIIGLMQDILFKDLKEAWSSILDIDFEVKSHETNPSMVNVINLSELVIISKFRIELDGGGGDFFVCLPYSMIEPIRELLNAGIKHQSEGGDDKWLQRLREEMMEAEVEACCTLTHRKISLKQVMKFKSGDVIDIEIPEEIILKVNDIPMFAAAFGTFEGKYAVKIIDKVHKTTSR